MTLFHLISEPAGCCSTNTPWGPGRGGFLFDPTGTSSTFSRGLMSAKGSSRFDLPTSRENRFNYISRPDFWFCKATSSSNDTLLLTIFFFKSGWSPGRFQGASLSVPVLFVFVPHCGSITLLHKTGETIINYQTDLHNLFIVYMTCCQTLFSWCDHCSKNGRMLQDWLKGAQHQKDLDTKTSANSLRFLTTSTAASRGQLPVSAGDGCILNKPCRAFSCTGPPEGFMAQRL